MRRQSAWLRTDRGRLAGSGMVEDDYSEKSGCKPWFKRNISKDVAVRFVTDKLPPESLNGPVIIVQEGRKKDG